MRADWSELPILRLPIPENPAARPFQAADFITLLTTLDAQMEGSRTALAQLGDRPFALEIAMSDLWFDINMNSTRDEGEDVTSVASITLAGAGRITTVDVTAPTVRFDTADAAWLSAYTNFLSGFANVALAYDPAPAIQRVIDSSDQIYAFWGTTPPTNALDMMFGRQSDRVAMALHALAQTPDASLTRKAHAQFLAMITENRRFWALVTAETDNDSEWVPNDRQVSALGIIMPPGTAARWQAVLADAEKLLTGDLLIPHWRFGAEAGINLRKLFENPVPINLITFIQGEGLLHQLSDHQLDIDDAQAHDERRLQRGGNEGGDPGVLQQGVEVPARQVSAQDPGQRAHDRDPDLGRGQEAVHVVLQVAHTAGRPAALGHQGVDAAPPGGDHRDLAPREEAVAQEQEGDDHDDQDGFAHRGHVSRRPWPGRRGGFLARRRAPLVAWSVHAS